MSVEDNLKQFIKSINILPPNVSFELKAEYLDDLQPQVYILREKNGKFQKRIRITSDRNDAVNIEEKICSLLETYLSDYFYPKIENKYENISGIGDVLITEYKEGVSLDKYIFNLSEMEYPIIIDKLSRNLKKMHSIKSSDFFDFKEFKSNNWFDFFEYKLKKYLKIAVDNRILKKKETEYITHLLYKEQDIFRLDCGSLIHFDIKPANIIWNPANKEPYLIDFEMSRYGDILMEFTKGKFTTLLFNNSIYENKIWKPLVEHYFSKPYADIFSSRKSIWYLFYHYLAYSSYQLMCFKTVSPCIFDQFSYYKKKLFL